MPGYPQRTSKHPPFYICLLDRVLVITMWQVRYLAIQSPCWLIKLQVHGAPGIDPGIGKWGLKKRRENTTAETRGGGTSSPEEVRQGGSNCPEIYRCLPDRIWWKFLAYDGATILILQLGNRKFDERRSFMTLNEFSEGQWHYLGHVPQPAS